MLKVLEMENVRDRGSNREITWLSGFDCGWSLGYGKDGRKMDAALVTNDHKCDSRNSDESMYRFITIDEIWFPP